MQTMETNSKAKVHSDERGIWCSSGPDSHYGIGWDEIYRVSAYRYDLLDVLGHDVVDLEIDFDWGEYVSFDSDWSGFEETIQAITDHLPDIDSLWWQRVKELERGQSTVVWKRPDAI